MSARDPRVDDYIWQLPEWQQEICRRLRGLIHAAAGWRRLKTGRDGGR
jgi:hypothetical protein